jgi:hypothetical protein
LNKDSRGLFKRSEIILFGLFLFGAWIRSVDAWKPVDGRIRESWDDEALVGDVLLIKDKRGLLAEHFDTASAGAEGATGFMVRERFEGAPDAGNFGVHGRTLILVKILKTLTAATKRMKGIHHTAEIPFQSA